MADDDDERFEHHEDILRRLTAMLVEQRAFNQQQMEINVRLTAAIERIDAAIERLDVTQARIETLLARMIQQSENGREA
jgi:hypothetical protein